MNNMKRSLSEVQVGRFVRIHVLQSEPETCRRLREIGFRENAIVRLVVNSDGNLICQVCDARIGLNHGIAKDIIVTPFT